MGLRDTKFPIPKNELYYWDDNEKILKPLIDTDGQIPVKLGGIDGNAGSLPVSIQETGVMQGVDIQSRYSRTVQMQNAVSIGANTNSVSSWLDMNEYTAIGITMINDAEKESELVVQWSNDGTNLHGEEVLVVGNSRYKPSYVRKSANFVRIRINNLDAVSHTFSSWVNLQV